MKALQELRFTEYEAKAYLALLEEAPLTGYAVAKHSGVPRSKIYEVLGSLTDKGAVLASHGHPVQYSPLPPKELLSRWQKKMEQALVEAEHTLDRFASQKLHSAMIWDIRGRHEIIERACQLISRTQQHLLIEVWEADADEFQQELQKAAQRGVAVTAVVYGDVQYPFATVYQHDLTDAVTTGLGGRWLVVSADMQEIIAGIISLGSESRAAWSRHIGLVIPITELVKHDIYKLEMLAAHRELLERTFGPGLAKLRERFAPFPGLGE